MCNASGRTQKSLQQLQNEHVQQAQQGLQLHGHILQEQQSHEQEQQLSQHLYVLTYPKVSNPIIGMSNIDYSPFL